MIRSTIFIPLIILLLLPTTTFAAEYSSSYLRILADTCFIESPGTELAATFLPGDVIAVTGSELGNDSSFTLVDLYDNGATSFLFMDDYACIGPEEPDGAYIITLTSGATPPDPPVYPATISFSAYAESFWIAIMSFITIVVLAMAVYIPVASFGVFFNKTLRPPSWK